METKWTPEQQKEHRKLWVEALRSGKYTQAENALQKRGSFCCLGVACDLSGLGSWEPDGDFGKSAFIPTDDEKDRSINYLPTAVVQWLGLSGWNPKIKLAAREEYLAMLNDTGTNFLQLADIIESEPEGLIAK